MKRIKSFSWLTLVIYLGASAQLPQAVETYLVQRLDSIPEIKSLWNRYESTLKQAQYAGGLPDPYASTNIFIKPIQTRVGPQLLAINVAQPFPFPGTLKSARESWEHEATAIASYITLQRAYFYKQAAQTWLEYAYFKKEVDIINEHLVLLKTLQKVIRERVAGGKEKAYNYLRIEMQIEEYETKLQIALSKLLSLQVSFNKILNLPDSAPIPIADTLTLPLIPDSLKLIDSILSSSPYLQVISHKLLANKARQRNARLSGLPSFSAGLSYFVIGNGGSDALAPSIGIRIPIYRKKWKALEERYELAAKADSLSYLNKENLLIGSFAQIWWQLTDALERIELYNELIDLSLHTRKMLIAAYSGDEEDFVEVLRIDRDLLNYRLAHQRALTDLYKAIVNITELTGK